MINPRHHPSLDILAAYSAGALEPGFGLVVGAHVQVCVECRRQVSALESVSGEALRDLPPEPVRVNALAQTLARLDTVPQTQPDADDRPLLEQLPLKPKRWVAPGVWVAAVDTPHTPDNRVYVLSVRRGLTTAQHGHSGAEFCTVLQGAYRDQTGVFGAGDFVAADGGIEHQPIVEGPDDCICLFATEGRLKPRGWVGRVAFALADV